MPSRAIQHLNSLDRRLETVNALPSTIQRWVTDERRLIADLRAETLTLEVRLAAATETIAAYRREHAPLRDYLRWAIRHARRSPTANPVTLERAAELLTASSDSTLTELDDAKAEIGRLHDHVVELREAVTYLLSQVTPSPYGEDDAFVQRGHLHDIKQLLNREVGA